MTDTTNPNQLLTEIEVEIQKLTTERKAISLEFGRPIVFEILAPLFEFPGVKSVYWTQHTPVYCDGDPCSFYVSFEPWYNYDPDDDEGLCAEEQSIISSVFYELYPKYTKESESERAQTLREMGWTLELGKQLRVVEREIEKWMDTHEEFMEETFGDGSEVWAYADGHFDVEEGYYDD